MLRNLNLSHDALAMVSLLPSRFQVKVSSNLFVGLAEFRHKSAVTRADEENGHTFMISNGLQISTKSKKAAPISSEDDFFGCLDRFITIQSLLLPQLLQKNFRLITEAREWAKTYGWKNTLEYIESVRIKRAGSFEGVSSTVDEALFRKHLTEPLLKGQRSKRSAQRAPRPDAKKRKQASNALDDSQYALCRSKSACIAFNGSGCSHQGDHTYKGLNLIHKCAKCDSDAHGLLACPN